MTNKNPLKNRKKVAILLFFGTILLLVVFAGRIAFIMVKGEVNGENLQKKHVFRQQSREWNRKLEGRLSI